jgi:hypothetical protein
MLRRFELVPAIYPFMGEQTKSCPGWQLFWERKGAKQPFQEYLLVQTIENFAENGLLDSLKRCPQCQRWLFARFSHQRFCTEECKEMFHRSDPADKQRRREWAKKNYQIHKTKNVK